MTTTNRAMKPNQSTTALLFYAVLSFTLAGVAFHAAFVDVFPSRASLQSISGQVSTVESSRNSREFELVGQKMRFHYSSKGRGLDLVSQAIAPAAGKIVNVLYEGPAPGSAVSAAGPYEVYHIGVNGNTVRSYEEVREAWASDNQVGAWLAGIFGALGFYFLYHVVREARRRPFR